MATKGTDGTNVGTTITTQGDILYRDGSGLQRLGAGTSGQYLKTQGTGANPIWADVSAEMVKLGSTAFTSGTPSSVNIDVTFDDSTYYKYELHGYFTKDGTTGAGPRCRVRQAGNTQSDSTYDYIINYAYRNLSSNSSSNSYGVQEDADHGRIFDWDFHGEDYPVFFKITSMAEMQNTSKHKTFQTETIGYRHSDNNYIHTSHAGFFGYEGNTAAITGMNFYNTSGSFKTGHLAWYGFKR
tara:strand:- start:189 stop:908 length:720 start_codon:yes stop_codon:yes gene_type:complete